MNRPEPGATLMFREAAQAPAAVRAQLARNRAGAARLGAQLRAERPRAVATCARGSSDHAATFAKYLVETRAGVITSSVAPAVSSVYGSPLDLADCLFIAISQSGRSPDLLATAEAAKAGRAHVVALVNAEDSPLGAIAHHAFALCAHPERGVAATKSYIASLAAIVHLVATWSEDAVLLDALDAAPELLARAWELDWSAAIEALAGADHLFVIGRGTGLAIAQEAALKLKETCALHAEAFSGAEVRHGPQALLGRGFPVLLLAQDDETRPGLEQLARDLVDRGVPVIAAGVAIEGAIALPTLQAHGAIQPLLLAQAFYRLANALAFARRCDPDRPPHLRKVTETL